MKKLMFLIMISALISIGVANGQTTGDKIVNTTKKAAKTTVKGVGKGYSVSKNTVVKGAKATLGGLKKIFT